MTFPINSPDNAVDAAYAAIKADDVRLQDEWDAARTPWQAVAQRCSPETRARRAALFAALERAKGARSTNGKLLNSAGRRQATLGATPGGITIGPAKTLEQIAAAAVRSSQLTRPVKASKKVAL